MITILKTILNRKIGTNQRTIVERLLNVNFVMSTTVITIFIIIIIIIVYITKALY